MGTDIHLFVEYKDNNGVWVVPKPVYIPCDRPECPYLLNRDYCYECDEGKINIYDYSNRNYAVFGLLAGVRYDIKPIAEPRGVPEDASIDYKCYIRDNGCCLHSFSYHTLTQLEKYNLEKVGYKNINYLSDIIESSFYTTFMTTLEELATQHGGSDNVRIVFCFDS